MAHENSRPYESLPCRLCAARFDDAKCYAVLSALTQRQNHEKVSSYVNPSVLMFFLMFVQIKKIVAFKKTDVTQSCKASCTCYIHKKPLKL